MSKNCARAKAVGQVRTPTPRGNPAPHPTLESSLSVRGEGLANKIEKRAYDRAPCNGGACRSTISVEMRRGGANFASEQGARL